MFEAITAWSTVAIALATIASIYFTYKAMQSQVQSLKDTVSADLALKLLRDFDTLANRQLRRRVAHGVLNNVKDSVIEELFDFFEQIGLYVRKGLIDAEIAHSFFFHWVNLYWIVGRGLIEKKRIGSIDLWKDFEFLFNTLLQIEMKSDPRSRFINPSDELTRACLEEECE